MYQPEKRGVITHRRKKLIPIPDKLHTEVVGTCVLPLHSSLLVKLNDVQGVLVKFGKRIPGYINKMELSFHVF